MKGEVNSEPPSIEEIWGWTMTADAIATCSAKDVYSMKENLLGGADFYWLGRIPCRTVCLVGLVVGVQIYESRVLYSLDDGTAVVDCAHRASRAPKSSSKKPKQGAAAGSALREMPIPIARVGRSIRVVGKVHRVHGTRQIQVDEIEICKSVNEEPLHWRKVRELHKGHYDLEEPFFIPLPSVVAAPEVSRVAIPSTPSTVMSTPTSSVTHSPIKSSASKASLPKLRHPSRLHSRDLTDNTFRIYVKHYMIYATRTNEISTASDAFDGPVTPTKSGQINATELLTPKPMNTRTNDGDRTPRIRSRCTSADPAAENKRYKGFTLSYLRRVPELADLGRRVVLAEAKRRRKEQIRKENEERSRGSALRKTSSAATRDMCDIPKDKLRAKMKRLFSWAIIQMLQEGCIVLWDGPMFVCNTGRDEISQLWRTSTSVSVNDIDSSIFGTSREVPEDDVLSEPHSDEEGYVPVTPPFLADRVEKIIRVLTSPVMVGAKKPAPKFGITPISIGVAKERILTHLRKDDRWKSIGEWQVQDALEFLRKESRIWCAEKDRWELTLSSE